MASTATTPPVVTGAGVRETVTLAGRAYVLAAPTLAEVGAFLEVQARNGVPGPGELTEAIRTALEELGEGDGVLTAAEEAEDAWVSFSSIHVITGPDATENIQAQASQVHLALLRTRRLRDRAVTKVARHPKVLEIKALQEASQWRENCALVALLLRGWSGEGLPGFPDELDGPAVEATLPMGDVGALARRAYQLMQPTADAGKA